ncbi:hypothetical protein [Vibrio fluvialis]|uniref:hypothetical protein n=1 Tax=Vibrio fluvialis TaxID=676 RepID=UPI00399A91F0
MKNKIYLAAILMVASSTAIAKVTYDEAKQAETAAVAANMAIDAGNQLKAGFSSNDLNGQSVTKPELKWKTIYSGGTYGSVSIPASAELFTVVTSKGTITLGNKSSNIGVYFTVLEKGECEKGGGTTAYVESGFNGSAFYGGQKSAGCGATATVQIKKVTIGYY